MQRPDRIPVGQTADAPRIKDSRLVDRDIPIAGHHLEFQPAASRHLHLGRQSQPPRPIADLHLPAVERLTRLEPLRVPPSACHAGATDHLIHPATQLPEPVAGIPAIHAADPLDRRERPVRRDSHHGVPMVHESRALGLAAVAVRQVLQIREVSPSLARKYGVFLEHCLVDGSRQRSGPDRKGVDRRIARDNGRIFESVDQLATHLRIFWCDELQPQARQPRRQDRHRNHEPPQAPLPGILLHDSAIRHPVRPTDLKNPRACGGQVDGRREIGDHIGDGDRLRGRGQPRRADHHRQPFHERPHQIERKTPGPDHDRRPEFHHVESAGPQDRSHFVTAPQVRGEPVIFGSQSTQIDDATDAGGPGSGREPLGCQPVGPLKIDTALHRVHEPVGHVDAVTGPREHLGICSIAGDDLGGRTF